jgi:hypothetical protein
MQTLRALLCGLALVSCSAAETDAGEDIAERCDALYADFKPEGDPSFKDEILPIFQLNCALSLCHSGKPENIQADLWLGPKKDEEPSDEDIEFVHRSLIDIESLAVPGIALVRPERPRDSFLMLKLDDCHNHPNLECALDEDTMGGPCGAVMPVLVPQLSKDERALVRSWIAQGAKLN